MDSRRTSEEASPTQPQGAADETHLSPEVEGQLSGWRARLLEIDQVQQPSLAEINQMRWGLGCEIRDAIDRAGPQEGRTPTIAAIAERLDCSASLVYNLTNVARAFRESLPRQRWDTLARLARMGPDERQRILADLPDWAPTRSVPSRRQHRELTPDWKAAKEESDRRAALCRAIEADFAALPKEERPHLVLRLLRSLDLDALPTYFDRDEVIGQFEQAVLRLRESVPEPAAAAGEIQAGDDAKPSG